MASRLWPSAAWCQSCDLESYMACSIAPRTDASIGTDPLSVRVRASVFDRVQARIQCFGQGSAISAQRTVPAQSDHTANTTHCKDRK
jgi:hypothetical protein